MPRVLKWSGGIFLGLILILGLILLLFEWNWLRGPIMRAVTDKTGRELVINGDLKIKFSWPDARITTSGLTFANPPWGKAKQMVTVENLHARVNLPQLFKKNVVLTEVMLGQAELFLEESADGRRNWLLDREQRDEKARVQIERLTLDRARLMYDNPQKNTSIQAEISSQTPIADDKKAPGIIFTAQGVYQGLPLTARGTGASVLALRDETVAYPLKVDGVIGATKVQMEGTITSLVKFSAIDMDLGLSGENLADLFPVLGIALPKTGPYDTRGHIAHDAKMWRYENFTGRIGASDIAGTLQVDTDGKRPFLHGELKSGVLNFADLGPVIGAKEKSPQQKKADKEDKTPVVTVVAPPKSSPTGRRVLPELPFSAERWNSVDADVKLQAKSIRRAKELPLEDLDVHLKMQDSVLTLDPLKFGVAGGNLSGTIKLNGQQNPIHATAKIQARKLHLRKLFPTLILNKTSIGHINGDFDVSGDGNSVAQILATADGKAAVVIAGGEISKMMMEAAGLHLWEMLRLKIKGDQVIDLNCGVADFNVKKGVMHAEVLLLDTQVITINADGSIDLAQENLDITLKPKTKQTRLIALRSPIYIRGSFSKPKVALDAGQVTARSLGAVALGTVNPLLALLPLVETGPGLDSDCGRLIREAQQPADKR